MLWPVFEKGKDWKLLDCKPKKTNDKEEGQETCTEVLMGITAANAFSVKIGNHEALENAWKEGTHYFVQWVGELYELDEVSNINKRFIPEGNLVCNTKYLDKFGYHDWLYLRKNNDPESVNLKWF